MRKILLRTFVTFLFATVCTAWPSSATAQQGGTTTYVHDDNGRLQAVISPTGEAVVYEYDAVGNVTAIRRVANDSLAVLNFSPREGLPDDYVKFFGVGFGGGVTDVIFNGAPGAIVSVSASAVVARVPHAATTGLVTITTPRGSVTTNLPFTITGLRIRPSFAALKFGQSVQFTVEAVPSSLGQNVQWSVDNAIGGNTTVGTISPAGFYTAPNTRHHSLLIRAASIADASRFAEARVAVSDPNDVQSVYAASVSVQKGDSVRAAAIAPAVSVRYNAVAASQTALAHPLSIQYENSSGPFAAHSSVSATIGPYIQDITPFTLAPGTTVNLTITGVGLTGATTLRFITASGSIDTGFSVSNLRVSADGAVLTAAVTASTTAASGIRTVVVATPNGDSVSIDLGINRINVQ